MQALSFQVLHRDAGSGARVGILHTPHGPIATPAFLPVGTQATVKMISPEELRTLRAQAILANTYHLSLSPGAEVIARLGGLHAFMAWDGPIVTDSGGFQVFSLGFGIEEGVGKIASIFPGEGVPPPQRRPTKPSQVRIDEDGVTFFSYLDGSPQRLTPERSIWLQEALGADIILAFDECTSPLATPAYTRQALQRTHRWALRCLEAKTRPDQALFGIVQGGAYRELREESARFITGLPFAGFAIGGSLGRSKAEMHQVLRWTVPLLPEDRPRHLLGIGEPEDLVACVALGIDLFDCVVPTRMGRNGVALTARGRRNLLNAAYREDPRPIVEGCGCPTCAQFSRAYLRHLFKAGEALGPRLVTVHNLFFVLELMRRLREALAEGTFGAFQGEFLARHRKHAPAEETP